MNSIANMLIGNLLFSIVLISGFALSLEVIYQEFGIIGAVIGFFSAPITLVAVPLYAGLSNGNWIPAIVSYGGFALCCALEAIFAQRNDA